LHGLLRRSALALTIGDWSDQYVVIGLTNTWGLRASPPLVVLSFSLVVLSSSLVVPSFSLVVLSSSELVLNHSLVVLSRSLVVLIDSEPVLSCFSIDALNHAR
jgi:hypothetical protein